MTYIVTENCIKCKYMDCVEVCPVDCFYEGENMLVIHPDECIDCGVCEPECPAEAIKPDTEPGLDSWLKLNTEYATKWPNITVKRDAPADAKEQDGAIYVGRPAAGEIALRRIRTFPGLKPEGLARGPKDSIVVVFDRGNKPPMWLQLAESAMRAGAKP